MTMENTKPIAAVFDFDGTLTKGDSFLPFLAFVVGRKRFIWGILILLPKLIGMALKFIDNQQVKEDFLIYFLRGLDEERLQKLGERFAAQKLPKMLRPEAVNRLEWHQKQGHKLILLSASPDVYLIPWCRIMAFSQVVCSRLEIVNGKVTGKLVGKNCYGEEKIARLQAVLGDLSDYCVYAYGDSRSDLPLLSLADYAYYKTFV